MADVETVSSVSTLAVTAAVGAVVLLLFLLCSVGRREKQKEEPEAEEITTKSESKHSEKHTSKKSRQPVKAKKSHVAFSHPWLAGTLKGHSSRVLDLDLSSNGKYCISISDDRAIMLWSTKEFQQKEHKFIRGNVELDNATKVAFSPDSKAFVTTLSNANSLRIFRLGKKEDGGVSMTATFDFPKGPKAEIAFLGIASNGRFIMTCGRDTNITIWSLKGEELDSIDTRQMNNSYGAVSPCGRFVASSGFTPDVKVWEVCFDKSGTYKETKRAFELKGHNASVYSFSFNNDSSRMASLSKDGTWKFWDTDVRYEMGQDPKLLATGTAPLSSLRLIALAPDARMVAMAGDTDLCICSTATTKEEQIFHSLHAGPIATVKFDISGRYILTTGDKHIQVLHNVPGYHATIAELEASLRTASGQGMKERIRQQIEEAETALNSILGEANGDAKPQ